MRIRCFVGGDTARIFDGDGLVVSIPAAQLVGPDGVDYSRSWIPDQTAREAMKRDWGETLVAARSRNPYHAAPAW